MVRASKKILAACSFLAILSACHLVQAQEDAWKQAFDERVPLKTSFSSFYAKKSPLGETALGYTYMDTIRQNSPNWVKPVADIQTQVRKDNTSQTMTPARFRMWYWADVIPQLEENAINEPLEADGLTSTMRNVMKSENERANPKLKSDLSGIGDGTALLEKDLSGSHARHFARIYSVSGPLRLSVRIMMIAELKVSEGYNGLDSANGMSVEDLEKNGGPELGAKFRDAEGKMENEARELSLSIIKSWRCWLDAKVAGGPGFKGYFPYDLDPYWLRPGEVPVGLVPLEVPKVQRSSLGVNAHYKEVFAPAANGAQELAVDYRYSILVSGFDYTTIDSPVKGAQREMQNDRKNSEGWKQYNPEAKPMASIKFGNADEAYAGENSRKSKDGSMPFFSRMLDFRVANILVRIEGSGSLPQKVPFSKPAATMDAMGQALLKRLGAGAGVVPSPVREEKEPEKEAEIEVQPSQGITDLSVGLIPASSLLPARICYKKGEPGEDVVFSFAEDSPGAFVNGKTAAREVTVKADASGNAFAEYQYDEKAGPLSAPLKVPIRIAAGEKKYRAVVNVGLGLTLENVKAVPGIPDALALDTPYAFLLPVKSTFYPKLNVADYVARAEASGVWYQKTVAVKLVTTWVNKGSSEVDDVPYRGMARIASAQIPGVSFLSAKSEPSYNAEQGRFWYPAVIMKTMGQHAYQLTAQIGVANKESYQMLAMPIGEKMVQDKGIFVLSSEKPTQMLEWAACSFQATDRTQWFMLEAVKLIPFYGKGVDYWVTGCSALCGLQKGEYEKTLLDVAGWAGGQYLDHLTDKEIIDALPVKDQNAVWAAFTTYFGIDMYKKKKEIEELPKSRTNG